VSSKTHCLQVVPVLMSPSDYLTKHIAMRYLISIVSVYLFVMGVRVAADIYRAASQPILYVLAAMVIALSAMIFFTAKTR